MNGNRESYNPLVSFERFWKIAEKITLVCSFALVFGTVGYVSLHALA
ncbi:hypothetical protein [Alicyclobacillus kakegawensis]|nr:hypothetical protein [Alicyclobacillus kakegawensis]